jgi:hypothetical protein
MQEKCYLKKRGIYMVCWQIVNNFWREAVEADGHESAADGLNVHTYFKLSVVFTCMQGSLSDHSSQGSNRNWFCAILGRTCKLGSMRRGQ